MTESGSDPTQRPVQSPWGCLLLLFATMGGYGVLTILALALVRQPTWQLSLLDAAYWAIALLIPLAQLAVPQSRVATSAATAQPGPMVRAAIIAVVAGVLWASAHSVHLA